MPTYVLPDLDYDFGALEPHISGFEPANARLEAARRLDLQVSESAAPGVGRTSRL